MALPTTTTITIPKLIRYSISIIVGILIGGLTMWLLQQSVRAEATEALSVRIDSQAATVASMAEITDRNGADATAASLIKDCPKQERIRFDELLSKLSDSIRWSELQELQQLFDECGTFYANQKKLMVMRLEREVATLEDYVELLSILNGDQSTERYRVSDWRQLVEREERQSETFSELVAIQKRIIDNLIEGRTQASAEIQEALEDARTVKELQTVLNIEIDTLRSSLTST